MYAQNRPEEVVITGTAEDVTVQLRRGIEDGTLVPVDWRLGTMKDGTRYARVYYRNPVTRVPAPAWRTPVLVGGGAIAVLLLAGYLAVTLLSALATLAGGLISLGFLVLAALLFLRSRRGPGEVNVDVTTSVRVRR